MADPRKRRGRPPKYDWELLGDGQLHVLYEGQDFETSCTSFRALVHRSANARGLKADTRIDKNAHSVAFTFFKP